MFFLSLIEHTLRLPPHLLDLSLDKTIQGELESQFLDKVIAVLGLCISVYDIRSIDGDFVFPADGASTYTYLLDSLKTSTDWSILCQIHPAVSLTHKRISPTFNFLMELKLDCSGFHHLLSFFLLFFIHFTATPYIRIYSVLLFSFYGIPGVKSYGYGIIKNKNFL